MWPGSTSDGRTTHIVGSQPAAHRLLHPERGAAGVLLPAQFITAVSDWGEIGYWALCNAQVDGYNLIVGDLENPVLIEAGDQVVIPEGDLSVSLGPFFLTEEE
jgi:hypothetical protein